jgi:3-oxoacyl-[acyl-carrier-protein] synthase II
MSEMPEIAVTGMGFELPGWGERPILDALDGPVAYGELDARGTLGKKGLRYKDRATLLALCAVQKALRDRDLLDMDPVRRANIGVCVSSNLGNMDTVCAVSETIHAEHVDRTSPMSLPVASSNVIPASIAIRYGLKAINLMLCNGATSGLDALHIAAKMLRSGRAEKMLVVGVEPLNAVSERLLIECDPEARSGPGSRPGEGAACLILEPIVDGLSVESYGTLGGYEFFAPGASMRTSSAKPDVWFVPAQTTARARSHVEAAQASELADVPVVDTTSNTGELYGALGVFQALVAPLYLRLTGGGLALLSNGLTFGDGLSSLQLRI